MLHHSPLVDMADTLPSDYFHKATAMSPGNMSNSAGRTPVLLARSLQDVANPSVEYASSKSSYPLFAVYISSKFLFLMCILANLTLLRCVQHLQDFFLVTNPPST
jgi:hypothetical protein